MKKVLSLICCTALILTFAACKKQPASDTQPTVPSTTVTTEPVTQPTETTAEKQEWDIVAPPTVSVALPIQNESFKDDGGNVLLNYNTSYIVLSMSEQEIADRITLEFLNRIDETVGDKDTILASAKKAFSGSGNWNPYQYTVTYEPKRVDNGVISLLGCDVRYLGAHIDKVYNSVNYSATTGHNLSLLNIIDGDDKIDELSELVIDVLTKLKDELYLYEDFEKTVNSHFSDGVNDAWFFSGNGLCFFFSPYDIAPYSSGVVIAEIPYEKLLGIIRDDFYPPEQANTPGIIAAKEYDENTVDSFSKYTELTIDKDGKKFLLYTDKYVSNIDISIGSRTSNNMLIDQYCIFAQSGLAQGEAIAVTADIDADHCLQITYRSGDKMIHSDIVYDAATGEISIMETE